MALKFPQLHQQRHTPSVPTPWHFNTHHGDQSAALLLHLFTTLTTTIYVRRLSRHGAQNGRDR